MQGLDGSLVDEGLAFPPQKTIHERKSNLKGVVFRKRVVGGGEKCQHTRLLQRSRVAVLSPAKGF